MTDLSSLLERADHAVSGVPLPTGDLERLRSLRDHKRRNQRIAAGVVGIAVFVAAVGLLAVGGSFDRTRTPALPGPTAVTGPSVPPDPDGGSSTRGTTFVLDERPGIYFVDVRTGEATRLPRSITDVALPVWDESGYQSSPDGSALLFIGASDDDTVGQIFIANIDGTDVRRMTGAPEGAAWANWSPDGSKIVYVEAGADDTNDSTFGSEMFLMDVATGEASLLASESDGAFQYPRFSPDGTTILFTRRSVDTKEYPALDLWTIPVTGGEAALLVDFGYDAVYSPDGTTIAFHRGVDVCLAMCHGGTTESQIWLADADGSDLRAFGGIPTSAPRWSPDGTRIAFGRAIRNDGTIGGVPIGSTGPGSESSVGGQVVFDQERRAFTTIVNAYVLFGWLDNNTLIVEI